MELREHADKICILLNHQGRLRDWCPARGTSHGMEFSEYADKTYLLLNHLRLLILPDKTCLVMLPEVAGATRRQPEIPECIALMLPEAAAWCYLGLLVLPGGNQRS